MMELLMEQAEQDCTLQHKDIQKNVEINQKRVLNAFRHHRISDTHLQGTTGYGYDDIGRDSLEAVYAEVFGGEDALVRPQLVSGTHAITTALFGVLRPGDELVYITGKPYDTMEEVIGKPGKQEGSLYDFNIGYREISLLPDGTVNYKQVKDSWTSNTKVIAIQRSKGYDQRPSFTIDQIGEMIQFVKELDPSVTVFVDNCYGEFTETNEPLHIGADLMAGSLIKNPGGGLVRAGGYIAGNKELIHLCANRLTAPGLGKETGASLGMLQEMYQGFFLASHIVGEALKGAILTARFLELAGFQTSPSYLDKRTDLIQTVTFDEADQMIAFCQSIQENSPINSYVKPYPSDMPGYEDQVIMAAGTFIQGSSIELSADGPIRAPYTAYVQGGLTYTHVKIALLEAIKTLKDKGLVS
ncbi:MULTISPECIES: methionine gamma-lyase family protein [unclassified Oceanobacillus]|uniref:methionine gamma-lyase family protein n=1 Tax=unclassified Oceanobacillus TaxID=2630292 RepID=UPI001BEB3671|nr:MULTISPECIES: methionine gamma-lyase family protein [unclassified Oceanobacillus]MBT2598605.1 methionine gamma-lyase family protein [Oceanobacillus sp. ISL-74]MBT2651524.1 methionine gamma-lyase family protein [Oceanobacillus sp. ISL-73]